MADKPKLGSGRINQNGFTFKLEDLKIYTFGSHTHALAIIVHIPTGITVEGHDPRAPGSVLAAKTAAMKLLSQKVEGHQHETFWDWSQEAPRWAKWLVGTPYAPKP